MRARRGVPAVLSITSTALALVLLVGGCSGADEPDEPGPTKASGAAAAGRSDEPEPQPVKVGPFRYVNACQVLPPGTVRQIFRPGPQSSFEAEFLDADPPPATVARLAKNPDATLDSRCTYTLRGKRDSFLTVTVRHFGSVAAARKDWRNTELYGTGKLSRQHLKRKRDRLWQFTMDNIRGLEANGGLHLPGLPRSVLFRKQTQDFLTQVANLVILVDHNAAGFDQAPAGPRNRMARQVGAALADVRRNAADPELAQTTPGTWGGGFEPVVDPCRLLDEKSHRALFKLRSSSVKKGSLRLDPTLRRPDATTPYARAPKASCERVSYRRSASDMKLGKSFRTTLQLLHEPDGADRARFLENSVQRMLFGTKDPTRYSLDQIRSSNIASQLFLEHADFAMVLADSSGPVKERNAFGVLSLGPFIVKVEGSRPDPAGDDQFCCDLTAAQVTTLMERVSANLARVAEEQDIDVSYQPSASASPTS